jgi:integrase
MPSFCFDMIVRHERHWLPVRAMYRTPLNTARRGVRRRRPHRHAPGGAIHDHLVPGAPRPARDPSLQNQERLKRTVSLNADAVAALCSAQRLGQRPKDLVFPREGANFDTRSWLKPCLQEAKIEDAVHHTARHTFCSWLALKGAIAHEIMATAGHKTLSVSARYTHLNPKAHAINS